jgi:hypothetical protein
MRANGWASKFWVCGRGLDHEGTKGAKDTKHEGRQGGIWLCPRALGVPNWLRFRS